MRSPKQPIRRLCSRSRWNIRRTSKAAGGTPISEGHGGYAMRQRCDRRGERALKITEGALTMISGTHGLKRKQRLLRRAMRKLKRWGEEPADAVVMPMPPILSPPVEDVGHPARITRDTARAEAAGGVRAGLICCAPKGTRSQRSWPRPSGPRRSCASPPTIRFAGGAGGARGELID